MIVTRLMVVSRSSILSVTTSKNLSFNSKKRPLSTLNPSLRSQGKYRGAYLNVSGKTNRLIFGIFSSIRSSMSSSMSRVSSEKQVERILEAKNDDHGGVIVEMTSEPMDPGVFASLLRASLSHWRKEGKRGVWIKVPIDLVNLVEPAIMEGFYFHHAEPRYLMLVHWLPSSANTLPANATHRVLVVQEKNGRFRGSGVWKFPTGVVDEGEDICDAAVREVKEETGIDSKFLEILALRQSHKSFFGKSDLFFVCMMQALSFEIQPQEAEIEAAQWMPYEEYTAQPFVQKHELLRYIADICRQKKEKGDEGYSGFSPVPTTTGFSDSKGCLYLNRYDLKIL
ncbi:nudix hydrolase 2-like isoform X2 [Primulina tabacum]|uniref:nudix hydrolase 2-like isoform X2 n=1 Tax=Primulina tabacum TaxID=48773 RepID=UPI003F59C20C